MLTNFFNYLRNRAREAVLAGVGDAVEELDHGPAADTSGPLALLRDRLRPSLPPPEEEATANGRRNGRARA